MIRPRIMLEAMQASLPNTMTPFLYQTRTVAGLRWLQQRPVARYLPLDRQRSFHCSHCLRDESAGQAGGSIKGHRNATESLPDELRVDSQTPAYTALRDVMFSYNPQGKLAATAEPILVQESEADYMETTTFQTLHSTATKEEDMIPMEGSDVIPSKFTQLDGLTNTRQHQRQSTITILERQTFHRIFEDLIQMRAGTTEDESRYPSIHASNRNPKALGNILKNAQSTKKSGFLKIPRSQEEKETAVKSMPKALRAGFAEAIGLKDLEPRSSPEDQVNKEATQTVDSDELEKLRQPERVRVEGVMRAAKTDFELWDVLEKEVFPLVAKLGLNVDSIVPARNKPRKGKKGDTSGEIALAKSPVEGVPPLVFYGPLYPEYLVLAMRLFDTLFARPSTLSLAILPKIKSLGLVSHVLGASTALYNDLIDFHAFRLDNHQAIAPLLEEMEQAGLEFDEKTLEILRRLANLRHSVLDGLQGATAKALWQMPEWYPHRFFKLRERIENMLREKKRQKNKQVNFAALVQ